MTTFNFTTGPSLVPDIGTLSYNKCTFSPLFVSDVSGNVVKDNAERTTKLVEYTISVDGYVTLTNKGNSLDISQTMATMEQLLTAQGGALQYTGRGFNLVINSPGQKSSSVDAMWGPVPELVDFQPLGGGLSAKVTWKVKVRIPQVKAGNGFNGKPLLQFNYETSVTYGDDYFSQLSIRGTVEIPMTRTVQSSRTLTSTVDDFRTFIEDRLLSGIDLSRFDVSHREFAISRDKRTMEFSITLDELPYMDIPAACTIARGVYSVRPAKAGMGLVLWLCTLRATYTVRNDRPRRVAWDSFLALLRLRMSQSQQGVIPQPNSQNPQGVGAAAANALGNTIRSTFNPTAPITDLYKAIFGDQSQSVALTRRAIIIDFSFDEGVYLDSKTASFSASWRLVTTFSHILIASGLWKKVSERDEQKRNLWATSISDVSGSRSWLPNKLDPKLDAIIDFGF